MSFRLQLACCLIALLLPVAIAGWLEADRQSSMRQQCDALTALQAAAEPAFEVRRQNAMVAATQPERDWDRLIEHLAGLEAELRQCRGY